MFLVGAPFSNWEALSS